MAYKKGKILFNAGLDGVSGGDRGVVYLTYVEVDGVAQWGLGTVNSSGEVTQYHEGYIRSSIDKATLQLASGIEDLVLGVKGAGWNTDLHKSVAVYKDDVFANSDSVKNVNGSNIIQSSETAPVYGSLRGDGITEADVETILQTGDYELPDDSSGGIGGLGSGTGSGETLAGAFKGALNLTNITNTISSPLESFKKKPIQTGIILAGTWELLANTLLKKQIRPLFFKVGSGVKKPMIG